MAARKPTSRAARFPRLPVEAQQLHEVRELAAEVLHVEEGVVARAVVDDEDLLELLLGVVGARDRTNAPLDHRPLVERRDDDEQHTRQAVRKRHVPRQLERAVALPEQALEPHVDRLHEHDCAEQMRHAAKQPRRDGRARRVSGRACASSIQKMLMKAPTSGSIPRAASAARRAGGFAPLHVALSPSDERANLRVLCTRRPAR